MTRPLAFLLIALAGCGAGKPQEPVSATNPNTPVASTSPPAKPEKPEPYEPGATVADVIAPFVRPERSSRLEMPLPRGKARERWTLPLEATIDPAFVLTAGTRIVVQGRARGSATERKFPVVILDTRGVRVASETIAGDIARIDAAAGKLFGIGGSGTPTALALADGERSPHPLAADDPRGPPGPLAIRAATRGGTRVLIAKTGVSIETIDGGALRPVVEPPVESLDASIDDVPNLHVIVRQGRELALWTTPLAGGSVGRIRIGPLRRDRAEVPPILGMSLRVIILDDRMIAIAPDGKTMWERKGALTGGATMSSDDRLLVANDSKVLAIDPSGRATELASAPKEIFLTPPIVTGSGLLVVASGSALHAYAFE